MKRRILAIFLVIAMVIGLLPTNAITVSATTVPSIAVNVSKKIDVSLAVGPTDVDYSNFSEDLTNALIKLGNISKENINVSELEASNVGTSGNFAWWTYDHTVPTSIINEQTHEYIELTAPTNNNGHAYYSLPRHIIVTNNGADLGFRGYGVSGNKDFMFIENEDPTKKTFQFDIEEGEAYDALDGVGFLFNTGLTGAYTSNNQLMSGYLLFLQYSTSGRGQEISLYKFSNVNTKSFHEGNPGVISNNQAFTKLASAPYSSTDKYRKVKIEVSPQKVKVWYKGSTTAITEELTNSNMVTWNVSGNNQTEVAIQSTNAYGFGPMGSYRSHNCNLLTSIDFKNLTMSTEEPKTLTEVIREPEWQSDSLKYIVNLNDQHINDFDDPGVTSEIINRLNNDDVYYVGWGSDENKEQTENFLKLNELKGDFVNTDSTDINTYQKQIDEIAYSILERYTKEVQGDTAHVLTTDNVNLTVSGADANDTIDPNWPNGKWKVVHTKEGFSNVTDEYIGNGQYVSDLNVNFNIPGKYEIYYEDSLVKTIIANRRPIASFDTVVSGSAISLNTENDSEDDSTTVATGSAISVDNETTVASGAAITYINMSYDPDDADGIDQTKNVWKYINLSDANPQWVESATPITHINADDCYLVSLIVTDKFGATSVPFTKQITYTEDGVKLVPFADFELSTSKIIKGNPDQFVTINDKSYDLYNEEIERYYTITKDGQPYEKGIQVGLNDFTLDTEGVYKISLTVHSINGYSQKITKTLTIIKDEIAPTATCNVSNGTETGLSRVDLQFSDLGNSGFGSQQVMITNSTDTPDTESPYWSASSSSLNRTLYLKNDGDNYIHYRAIDLAGNVKAGYFGPIKYEANNPYVLAIVSPLNNAVDQSVITSISFQASEKVKKGDGYLTIYDKLTDKKVMQIHSSNNRVKINNTGLVTVELPDALSYNTSYYVTVGTDFIYDESNKGFAQYGDANNWSFTTISNTEGTRDEDITITKVEASQTIGDVTTTPLVNVDPTTTNTYNVYVKAGEFTLLPYLSASTDNITLVDNDCTATLSADKKSILVDLSNGAVNPWVRLTIGDSNSYLFKIIQTDKEIGAVIDISTTDVNTSVANSNLLNAVDLTSEMTNTHVEKVQVRLLISQPQIQAEKDALLNYIKNNTVGEKSVLFDASLLKTVTYDNSLPTSTNIVNTQEPIKIIVDIPVAYQRNYSYQIIRYHGSAIDELDSSVLNNGTQIGFETDRFSTYAIVYTSAPVYSGPDAVKEEVDEVKEISVPKTITVTAGKTKSIEIANLPEGAVVNYHVNTPTIISLDKNGVMFPKKAGNAEVYVLVKTKDTSKVYKVTVKIKESKVKSTAVGFIQYYDDIVTYKNVNYRITKESVNGSIGTVAVANNQVNTKLPSEVVIPAKVKIDGHYYLVTSIDESAFYNVKTLKKISIPYTIKDISQTAFIGCKILKVFNVSKDNTNYSARNGMLLDKSGTLLIAYPTATGKITIDSKITTIGAYAFSVCRGLTQVTIPSTVKTIEGCAFAHSKALTKVKFNGDVPNMPYPCIFDSINSNATIYVRGSYLTNYQRVFKGAEMPKGVTIKK